MAYTDFRRVRVQEFALTIQIIGSQTFALLPPPWNFLDTPLDIYNYYLTGHLAYLTLRNLCDNISIVIVIIMYLINWDFTHQI